MTVVYRLGQQMASAVSAVCGGAVQPLRYYLYPQVSVYIQASVSLPGDQILRLFSMARQLRFQFILIFLSMHNWIHFTQPPPVSA